MRTIRGVRGAIVLALSATALMMAGPAEAGGGCHDSVATTAWGTTVHMKGACFLPTVVRVGPGANVTWENVDAMSHVVMGLGWGGTDQLAPGESVTYRFGEPGIYPYTCFYHPGMVGAVVVGGSGGASTAGGSGVPTVVAAGDRQARAAAGPDREDGSSAGARGSAGPWPVAAAAGLVVGAGAALLARRAFRRSGARAAAQT